MERIRTSLRVSVTAKDLWEQVAHALGLSLGSTIELLIRERAIALGIRPREAPAGPCTTGGD